ncbi:hypothetical protein QYE76_059806 [Lolium multiflorum]|uniref:Uncharacterized protein n=1 Tax=Lolium multiflorum TaxID=4521 RepID=A0AAD8W380_LOLMU|nr:hypothetical protein QYE76_059806 [Lolium multiflorum]
MAEGGLILDMHAVSRRTQMQLVLLSSGAAFADVPGGALWEEVLHLAVSNHGLAPASSLAELDRDPPPSLAELHVSGLGSMQAAGWDLAAAAAAVHPGVPLRRAGDGSTERLRFFVRAVPGFGDKESKRGAASGPEAHGAFFLCPSIGGTAVVSEHLYQHTPHSHPTHAHP